MACGIRSLISPITSRSASTNPPGAAVYTPSTYRSPVGSVIGTATHAVRPYFSARRLHAAVASATATWRWDASLTAVWTGSVASAPAAHAAYSVADPETTPGTVVPPLPSRPPSGRVDANCRSEPPSAG